MATNKDLQKRLKEELETMFKDYRMKGEDGESTPFHFYEGAAPIPKTDEDPTFIPYMVARTAAGKVPDDNYGFTTARALIIVATYENDEAYPSNADVLQIIDKIIERFQTHPSMGAYTRTGDIEWTLSDEDTYPYFFGGVELSFILPTIFREDEYA